VKKPKLTPYNDYATWVAFDVMANFQVRLIFSDDLRRSAIARLGSPPDIFGDGFVFNVKGEGRSYLFLKSDADEAVVAHECWHIVFRIMEWCGAELDNETVAYHLDHLVEKVYAFKKSIAAAQAEEKKDVSKN
jgi:hypothetical protein